MEDIKKGKLISSGKAKSLYESSNPDYYFMHYRDDTSAFDGVKKESLEGKGSTNNKFNAFIMDFLEQKGVPTYCRLCGRAGNGCVARRESGHNARGPPDAGGCGG